MDGRLISGAGGGRVEFLYHGEALSVESVQGLVIIGSLLTPTGWVAASGLVPVRPGIVANRSEEFMDRARSADLSFHFCHCAQISG